MLKGAGQKPAPGFSGIRQMVGHLDQLRERSMATLAVLLLSLTFSSPTHAARGHDPVDRAESLAVSQAAIGRSVRDLTLQDARGRTVRLSDFRGRPLVVNMVYTSCSDACPVVTQSVADAAAVAWDALGGESFAVITVGFDTSFDTAERVAGFARRQGATGPTWRFLSGELPTVAALSDDLGFVFYRSAKGFDHLFQTTILDAEGRVYRQVYGATFDTPLFVEPLKDLVLGTTSPFASLDDLVKKIRLFCTIYDPAADRYRFETSLFVQLAVGALVVLLLGTFVIRNWIRILRRDQSPAR